MTSPQPRAAELARLLAAVGRQDRAAYGRLYVLLAPRLKGFFLRQGAGPVLAEDLVQDTMLQVWRKAGLYDPARGDPGAWVLTLARHLRVDAMRRDRLAPLGEEALPDGPDPGPDPEDSLGRRQAEGLLREALRDVPEAQRAVLLLAYFGERPHSAIGRDLALPLGTVKGRLRLAVARLRSALAGRLG